MTCRVPRVEVRGADASAREPACGELGRAQERATLCVVDLPSYLWSE